MLDEEDEKAGFREERGSDKDQETDEDHHTQVVANYMSNPS